MDKIFYVARREFLATVMTRGFLISVLVLPVVIGVMAVVMPVLMNEEAPSVEGEVAIIDPTGQVAPEVAEQLSPEAIAARRGDFKKKVTEQVPEGVDTMMQARPGAPSMDEALDAALGEVPKLTIHAIDDGDLEAEKELLRQETPGGLERLALVVVEDNAVREDEAGGEFGSYQLFVREKLDDRIEDEIKGAMRRAIIDARLTAHDLDPERVGAMTRVERVRSTTVTEEGEQKTNEVLNIFVPAGFMILLLVSVLTGSQSLLTTTIEEKSSRVVEVILSAVSPMQMMTGKIIGQMCVGLLLLAIYAGLGVLALASFAFLGLIDPLLFVFLLVFYVIAYFTIASIMAAIGSAVTELREAQSLMTPVMLLLMIPWMLWLPITRDPNSTFSTVLSFIPPVNSFVILLRMASTSPPPLWQVLGAMVVGIIGAWLALKAAAKIFRIGLLLFGKPPSFKTLLSWIRMA